MRTAMTKKERYYYLKAQGRCVQCGKHTTEGAYCAECKKVRIKIRKKQYDKHKEEHRCISCGKVLERDDKGVRCKACAEENRATHKRWYYRNGKIKVLKNIKNALQG